MNEAEQQLRENLPRRCKQIAQAWYRAISKHGFAPYSAAEVRQRLLALSERAVAFLLAETADPAEAQAIGAALGDMRYTQPIVLQRTQEVMGRLLEGLPNQQAAALQPRLTSLLAGLTAGFFQKALEAVLEEQEHLRQAFASSLIQAIEELRAAYNRVEQQVQERTAELRAANKALEESEARFRRIIENTPIGYYRIGKDGLWEYANPSWMRGHVQRKYGYSEPDIIGKHFELVQHPGSVQRARDYINRVLSGETVKGEFKRQRKDDVIEYYSFIMQPVREGDEIVAVETFMFDITDRVRAEQRLRESQETLHLLAEHIDDVIFRYRLKPHCGFDYISPAVERLSGYTPVQLCSDPNLLLDLAVPEDRPLLRHLLKGGSPDGLSLLRWRRQDGTMFWTEQKITPIYDEKGELVAVEGVARDVTERIQAEKALQVSEARYRTLFEEAYDAIMICNQEGRILEANQAAARYSGYTCQELKQMHIADLVAPEFRANVPRRIAEIFRTGHDRLRTTHIRKDGSRVPVEVSVRRIEYDGRPALVGIVRDLRERPRWEDGQGTDGG